jgi:uncharacterized protein YpmS
MKTKLTLNINENVVKNAKFQAKNTGRSLSELVENYLKNLTTEQIDYPQLSPQLKRMAGTVKLPSHFNEKTALAEYFHEKYQ